MLKRIVQIIIILTSCFAGIKGQRTSTGLIPLNDLKTGLYKSFQGGLYPKGENDRPSVHDSLGIIFSKQIKPLDNLGNIDTSKGKIVFLSVGMSNTTQEFTYFKSIADTDRTKNPNLVIVDGAQGGQTASIISNSSAQFWTVIEQRLQASGVNNKQVQACWLKEADAGPTQQFPVHANILRDELCAVVRNVKERYPNCKIAYLSSRTYGGYATSNLNPEPYAYESGFSVKWVIEKQINGDTTLECRGGNPKAPWLSWGPYFWADGLSARSDGLIWQLNDFVTTDGTHPSTSGRKKVAEALMKFLKTDLTAHKWFLKNSLTSRREKNSDILPEDFVLYQNYPNPFNPETVISYKLPVGGNVSLKVFDMLGREVVTLVDEFQQAGLHYSQFPTFNLPADRRGSKLSSGTYLYQIRSGNFMEAKKMILLK